MQRTKALGLLHKQIRKDSAMNRQGIPDYIVTMRKPGEARIRQNHMDDILEAIENIRHSSFLQGQNKNGWMVTFDWFLKPGNFAKVFEGQYADKSTNRPCSYMEKIQNRVSEVDNWV